VTLDELREAWRRAFNRLGVTANGSNRDAWELARAEFWRAEKELREAEKAARFARLRGGIGPA
jgi:hypothetical protein